MGSNASMSGDPISGLGRRRPNGGFMLEWGKKLPWLKTLHRIANKKLFYNFLKSLVGGFTSRQLNITVRIVHKFGRRDVISPFVTAISLIDAHNGGWPAC